MPPYREDLAYIHDVGFNFFANGAGPELLKIFREKSISDGLVVDLGCGSGIWARQLADAGYDVLGIDISTDMIKLSRQRVPEGEFRSGSLLKAKLPPCNAVTSLGECFNYLFDKDNNKAALTRVFRRVFDALQPGGLFIFDVAEPGRGAGWKQKHWQGEDWAILVEVDEDKRTQRLTRRMTTFRKAGKAYRRGEATHVLQLYDGAELAAELREVGFRVRRVRGYGDMRFPFKGYGGIIARKPN